MTLRRVAVTGVGVLSPAGGSLDEFWETSVSGRSALSRLRRLDVSEYPVKVGGEVDDALFEDRELPGSLKKVDRAMLLAQAAGARAMRDAGLDPDSGEPKRVGLLLGTGGGPTESTEEAFVTFATKGWQALRPRTVPRLMFNCIGAEMSIAMKLIGPHFSLAAACASANMAMSRALDTVRFGREKMVLTGGVDMPLCPSAFTAWAAMRILATSEDPQQCCLPFHARRNGFSLAEGAAFFMFEDLDSARERGATIYAEALGYGENSDAMHITRSDPERQAACIAGALEDAGVRPEDVDYINAHGTGTHVNDLSESQAIELALGEHAKRVLVSSTKSVIGHAMGASGAIELVAVLGALRRQTAPPTANLDEVDPDCHLDYVPRKPREAEIEVALSNSFAFGGANSVMVFRRYKESA